MNDFSRWTKLALGCAVAVLVLTAAPALAKDAAKKKAKPAETKARVVEIAVTENGYEPSPIKVKKGEALLLTITRKTDKTCATDLVLPDAKINVALPLNEKVEVPFTPDKTGEIKYGCAMGQMISGVLLVE